MDAVDGDGPIYWRVCDGVQYTEIAYSSQIRPPLLSEWERGRAGAFNSSGQRDRWLAARTVAKALVRERLGMTGIVEIRDHASGHSMVYRNGLPVPDVWLSIEHRCGRIAAIVADRPVALDIQRIEPPASDVLAKVVTRGEGRAIRGVVRDPATAFAVGWAAKQAAIRAVRAPASVRLADVRIGRSMGVSVGERHLHLLGVRVLDRAVVSIVGRPLLHEQLQTRVVTDRGPVPESQPSLVSAIERSIARARRIAEGRARWQRLRWEAT